MPVEKHNSIVITCWKFRQNWISKTKSLAKQWCTAPRRCKSAKKIKTRSCCDSKRSLIQFLQLLSARRISLGSQLFTSSKRLSRSCWIGALPICDRQGLHEDTRLSLARNYQHCKIVPPSLRVHWNREFVEFLICYLDQGPKLKIIITRYHWQSHSQ